jgi:hypothetical protein
MSALLMVLCVSADGCLLSCGFHKFLQGNENNKTDIYADYYGKKIPLKSIRQVGIGLISELTPLAYR